MAVSTRHIVVIQGHPNRAGGHFCHALATAYERGARGAGHDVDGIEVAALDLPFISSREDHATGAVPGPIRQAQLTILRADHLVLIHPIWNGGAPARLRAFMEQVFRPGFTFPDAKVGQKLKFSAAFTERKGLADKSARVITTMQMPALVYRWYFRPHQEASALRLGGASPVRETPIGLVDSSDGPSRERWLRDVEQLGAQGL